MATADFVPVSRPGASAPVCRRKPRRAKGVSAARSGGSVRFRRGTVRMRTSAAAYADSATRQDNHLRAVASRGSLARSVLECPSWIVSHPLRRHARRAPSLGPSDVATRRYALLATRPGPRRATPRQAPPNPRRHPRQPVAGAAIAQVWAAPAAPGAARAPIAGAPTRRLSRRGGGGRRLLPLHPGTRRCAGGDRACCPVSAAATVGNRLRLR